MSDLTFHAVATSKLYAFFDARQDVGLKYDFLGLVV